MTPTKTTTCKFTIPTTTPTTTTTTSTSTTTTSTLSKPTTVNINKKLLFDYSDYSDDFSELSDMSDISDNNNNDTKIKINLPLPSLEKITPFPRKNFPPLPKLPKRFEDENDDNINKSVISSWDNYNNTMEYEGDEKEDIWNEKTWKYEEDIDYDEDIDNNQNKKTKRWCDMIEEDEDEDNEFMDEI